MKKRGQLNNTSVAVGEPVCLPACLSLSATLSVFKLRLSLWFTVSWRSEVKLHSWPTLPVWTDARAHTRAHTQCSPPPTRFLLQDKAATLPLTDTHSNTPKVRVYNEHSEHPHRPAQTRTDPRRSLQHRNIISLNGKKKSVRFPFLCSANFIISSLTNRFRPATTPNPITDRSSIRTIDNRSNICSNGTNRVGALQMWTKRNRRKVRQSSSVIDRSHPRCLITPGSSITNLPLSIIKVSVHAPVSPFLSFLSRWTHLQVDFLHPVLSPALQQPGHSLQLIDHTWPIAWSLTSL